VSLYIILEQLQNYGDILSPTNDCFIVLNSCAELCSITENLTYGILAKKGLSDGHFIYAPFEYKYSLSCRG